MSLCFLVWSDLSKIICPNKQKELICQNERVAAESVTGQPTPLRPSLCPRKHLLWESTFYITSPTPHPPHALSTTSASTPVFPHTSPCQSPFPSAQLCRQVIKSAAEDAKSDQRCLGSGPLDTGRFVERTPRAFSCERSHIIPLCSCEQTSLTPWSPVRSQVLFYSSSTWWQWLLLRPMQTQHWKVRPFFPLTLAE